MPYININEIDNTQYGLSELSNNNIVYCPINAICGTYEPTLIESYDSLIKEYGNTGCVDDISFTYIKDIILSGFPVLCKRIRYTDVKSESEESDGTANNKDQGRSSGPTFVVSAKYHGSYMNNVSIKIKVDKTGRTAIVTVKKCSSSIDASNDIGSLLESAAFYCTLSADNNPDSNTIALDLQSQIIDYEFKYIKISEFGHQPQSSILVANSENKTVIKGGLDLSNYQNEVSKFILRSYGAGKNNDNYERYLGFLNDKYMFDVKFITASGYTYLIDDNFSQSEETAAFTGMITLCDSNLGGRGDCFAIPDIPKDVDADDVRSHFQDIDTTYAGAYAPWCYNKLFDGTRAWMPPSYVFLTNLAQSAKNTPIYYPPAGVNRMLCRRTIKAEYEIGAKILNDWQPKTNDAQCINPIMRIRGSGYSVYGQRTLVNLISPVIATSLKSITVRFCAIEIKKAIFNACIQLTFEQNILRTWNEFKSKVETTLLEMKKNGGLNSYQIIMDRSTISDSDINNNIARGIVRAAINDALENFEIGFEISPSYVSFDDENETLETTVTTDTLN